VVAGFPARFHPLADAKHLAADDEIRIVHPMSLWLSRLCPRGSGGRYSHPMPHLSRFICPRPLSGREGSQARA
jgi:hypothetical protein